MAGLTSKQTFMETCLSRLFKKMNQDLTKMEKMVGEKDSFESIIEKMIATNIVKIHEKITLGFPQSAIYFQDATDYVPEEHDGTSFVVIPLGGIRNMSHAFEEAFIAMAFIDENGIATDAVVYNPFSEDMYYASYNSGAFSLYQRLKSSKRKSTCDIVAYLNADNSTKEDYKKLVKIVTEELKENNPVRISEASLLDMILVTAGKKDAFVATGLTMQEVIICKLFAQESAAMITVFKSKEVTEKTNSIVVANSKLHAKILQRL